MKSQKFTSGEFEFGLLSFENDNLLKEDSIEFVSFKNYLEKSLKMSVAFNPNKVVIISEDKLRVVLDVERNLAYEFYDIPNDSYFVLNSLSKYFAIFEGLTNVQINEITEEVNMSDYKFGLDCVKYEYKIEDQLITNIITSQIEMPKVILPKIGSFENTIEGFAIETISQDTLEQIMVFGLTSFSPNLKDTSIFSIDTTNYENRTSLINSFRQFNQDIEDKNQQTFEAFGKYKPKYINLDLIQKLADQGVLDNKNYKVSNALSNDDSYDIPNILLLNNRSESGFQYMEKTHLFNIFKENNILSPTLDSLLTNESILWDSLTNELKFTAICVAAIKDHLNKEEIKLQIIENLDRMKYGDFKTNSLSQLFKSGEISYEELLNEVNVFERLYPGYATSDDELLTLIKEFYLLSLKDSDLEISFSAEKNILNIKINQEDYHLDINTTKEPNYENYDDSQLNKYKDSTLINISFYQSLLSPLKQIAADNDLEMAYFIYHLYPPFTHNMSEYEYEEIIQLIPQLKIGIDAIYLNKFPKEDFFSSERLGTSFEFHPSSNEEQIYLGNFRQGDDPGADYITTKTKREFLQFAQSNEVGLSISKEKLPKIKDEIYNTLCIDEFALIPYLDNISIKPGYFYKESLNETKKIPFRDAYPSIYKYFGDRCKKWYIKKNSIDQSIALETSTKDIIFDSTQDLIGKILAYLKMDHIELFEIPYRQAWVPTEYLLLTKDQKKAIEKLFKKSLFF